MYNAKIPKLQTLQILRPAETGYGRGFTLIELSIVLVIIGLIVGGVLVGQNLISASQVRATITQVEKYNAAVNSFRGKFGGLPGDLQASLVTQFGFTAAAGRAGTTGLGNGDGLIDGINQQTNTVFGLVHTAGEQAWFWEDLSTNSNLIEGGFNSASATNNRPAQPNTTYTGSAISQIIPEARLGGGNYFIVQENAGINYFVLSAITAVGATIGDTYATPNLTVSQANSIDKKLDDGLPQSGSIMAQYANQAISGNSITWAAGGGVAGISPGNVAAASTTSCYDNAGNASNPMTYSITTNNGAGTNCALSFKFQ